MWYIPALVGQEVILNPERNGGNSKIGMKAHIIRELDTNLLSTWSKNTQETIGGLIVKVKFTNGDIADYYLKRLLPVGIPDKNYMIIATNNIYIRGIEGDESFEQKLDAHIIQYGEEIRSKKVYDNTYRRKYIKSNIDYLTNLALKKPLTQEQADAWMELQRVYDALPPSKNVETFVEQDDSCPF